MTTLEDYNNTKQNLYDRYLRTQTDILNSFKNRNHIKKFDHIMNKESDQNSLAYARDENLFSVLDTYQNRNQYSLNQRNLNGKNNFYQRSLCSNGNNLVEKNSYNTYAENENYYCCFPFRP